MKNNRILKRLAMKAKNRFLSNSPSPVCEYKIIDLHEEEFVDKVRSLLKTECLINPIDSLMEKSVLKGLDEIGKEKYLLETVDRYLKALDKIDKEKID